MAPKKRPDESYAQYILRISNKPSSVYKSKPKPKPKSNFVENVNKTAASNAPVSKVFKSKPAKTGSVEWMASQGKPKPKTKDAKPAEVKPAKPPVQASEQKPTVVRNPSPKPQPKADSKPMEKAYGESGKELYQAAKKNNPLMQRTFGYQTGGAPSQKTEKETPTSKQGSSASSTFEQNKLKIEQDKTAKPFNTRNVFPKKKKKD